MCKNVSTGVSCSCTKTKVLISKFAHERSYFKGSMHFRVDLSRLNVMFLRNVLKSINNRFPIQVKHDSMAGFDLAIPAVTL